ncbi:MAG: hypothetical protein U0166_25720 [Acidobacteriota bacterium]
MPVAIALLSLLPLPAFGWGHDAHELINDAAIDALPDGPLKERLVRNRPAVVFGGAEPDLIFRAHYDAEAERHFFNLDQLDRPDERGRYGGAPLTEAALEGCGRPRTGRLPIAIAELYEELVAALSIGDDAKAARTAGLLGHYVGDATMPLHATGNFDGQETGNAGVHFLLEVPFFHWAERRITKSMRRQVAGPDGASGDARALAIALLEEGIRDVPALLAIDARASRAGGDMMGRSPRILDEAVPIVARQMARASRALAGLWLAAERDARPPSPRSSSRPAAARGKKTPARPRPSSTRGSRSAICERPARG